MKRLSEKEAKELHEVAYSGLDDEQFNNLLDKLDYYVVGEDKFDNNASKFIYWS